MDTGVPVHLIVQMGSVMPAHNKHFLGNQQKGYFALAYFDSLLLFIFFHLQVYMIENECF